MAKKLEHSVAVTVYSRALPLCSQELEDIADVGHVEVSAQTEILSSPVVTPQERVYVFQASLTRCRISQMAHVHLSEECVWVGIRVVVSIRHYSADRGEYFRDGILAFGFLSEHIFVSRLLLQFDACYSSTLLTTVVLFLHH